MYEEALALDRTESFGYTVQILPAHRLLADGVELRLVVAPFEGTGLQAGVLMR